MCPPKRWRGLKRSCVWELRLRWRLVPAAIVRIVAASGGAVARAAINNFAEGAHAP